jgi:hypothetical protein
MMTGRFVASSPDFPKKLIWGNLPIRRSVAADLTGQNRPQTM